MHSSASGAAALITWRSFSSASRFSALSAARYASGVLKVGERDMGHLFAAPTASGQAQSFTGHRRRLSRRRRDPGEALFVILFNVLP